MFRGPATSSGPCAWWAGDLHRPVPGWGEHTASTAADQTVKGAGHVSASLWPLRVRRPADGRGGSESSAARRSASVGMSPSTHGWVEAGRVLSVQEACRAKAPQHAAKSESAALARCAP
uniref:hypothetical protein n=1 Tax=Streptomyces chartreusis TaxID=1969 RepID=UPI003F492B2A